MMNFGGKLSEYIGLQVYQNDVFDFSVSFTFELFALFLGVDNSCSLSDDKDQWGTYKGKGI